MKIRCPAGWKPVRLNDLGEVNRGRSRHRPRHAPHLYGGPYPFIQTADVKASGGRITKYTQTYSEAGLAQSRLWPAGTMCITIAANIAETGILQFPACFPDSVIGFIGDPLKCDVKFVEYAFRFLKRFVQYETSESGTVQDNINLGTIERLHFPAPPLPEQHVIASVLGALDDKIELNCRLSRTLENIAAAIFKSWFVDFDPVVAKAAGYAPYGLDPDTAALFPARFQESDLGPIPEGWNTGRMTDLVVQNRESLKPPAFPDEVFDHYSIPAFKTDEMPVRESGSQIKSNKWVVTDGVILISKLNPETPRVWWPQVEETPRAICSTEFIVTAPAHNGVPVEYIYSLLRSSEFSREFATLVTGTSKSHQRVKPEDFLRMPAVIPSSDTLKAFQVIVDPLLRRARLAKSESVPLAAIRDALLPKLFSGEIRVRDV